MVLVQYNLFDQYLQVLKNFIPVEEPRYLTSKQVSSKITDIIFNSSNKNHIPSKLILLKGDGSSL